MSATAKKQLRRRPATAAAVALDAFGAGTLPDGAHGALRDLPISKIEPNADQPRRSFDPKKLDELAGQIKNVGVLQPIVVRPLGDERFSIVMGERRWRASQLVGNDTIPAIVRDVPEAQVLEMALIENLGRHDLSPMEEARTLATLRDGLSVTQKALGGRIGKSQTYISMTIRLLDLPEEAVELLEARKLSWGHGKTLLSEPDDQRRASLARKAAEEQWSVRRLEDELGRGKARKPATPKTDTAATKQRTDRLQQRFASAAVRRRGSGYAVELRAADLAEVDALLEQLGA